MNHSNGPKRSKRLYGIGDSAMMTSFLCLELQLDGLLDALYLFNQLNSIQPSRSHDPCSIDDTGRCGDLFAFATTPQQRTSEVPPRPKKKKKQCHFVAEAWVISLLEMVKDLAEGWLLVESFDTDK